MEALRLSLVRVPETEVASLDAVDDIDFNAILWADDVDWEDGGTRVFEVPRLVPPPLRRVPTMYAPALLLVAVILAVVGLTSVAVLSGRDVATTAIVAG